MFLLSGILRAETQEKILLYLMVRQAGYGKAIAEFFSLSTNSVQKQLARLEQDSVVVSHVVGRKREYRLNPDYVFYEPLRELLIAALEQYPEEIVIGLAAPRAQTAA
ncbi:MAG: winged helix-turn-helix domain-containing protein [Gammaproteobacteria bacterium]